MKAARGDVVVSVRALGKVVDAQAPASILAVPSAGSSAASAGGQPAAASAAGASQLVFPQVGGRVAALLVSPGRHVAPGQILARLESAGARGNLVSMRAALDQAKAQLEIDRLVTPQSLASAKAAVAAAAVTLAGARDAFRHAVGVNRETVAGDAQQVAQARAQLAADARAPSPAATAAAEAAIASARDAVTAAQTALADVRAVNDQQVAAAEHAVEAAGRELGSDQSRLERDLATERRLCAANSPIITADTSPDCANAAAAVASDQQAIVKDQGAVQAATDALAQARVTAAQSEHQAQVQVVAAVASSRSAARQLAALKREDAQTIAKDRQALAAARSVLTQARTKAAEGMSQARAQVEAAVVGRAGATAALVALERGVPAPLLAQDRSKIQAAEAQVAAAGSALAQTIVRAPTAGTVTSVFVAAGSPIDGSTPIAAIADLKHLAVNLDLSEFDVAQIRPGMGAMVSVDALGGRRFPGRVVFAGVSGVDNGGVVTFPVRVDLDRVPGVRIGMSVSASIVIARRRRVVKAPLEAVSLEGRGRGVVTVVDAAGRSMRRAVGLGLASNKEVEVTRGLRGGERLELQAASGA